MDNMLLEKYASMMQKQASIKLQQEYGMEKQAFSQFGINLGRQAARNLGSQDTGPMGTMPTQQPSGQSGFDPKWLRAGGIGLSNHNMPPELKGINWWPSLSRLLEADYRDAMTGPWGGRYGDFMEFLRRRGPIIPAQQPSVQKEQPSVQKDQPSVQKDQPFAQPELQTPNYSDQIDQWGGTLGRTPTQQPAGLPSGLVSSINYNPIGQFGRYGL